MVIEIHNDVDIFKLESLLPELNKDITLTDCYGYRKRVFFKTKPDLQASCKGLWSTMRKSFLNQTIDIFI